MTQWLILIPLLPLLVLPGLWWPRYRSLFLSLAPWSPFPALLLALDGRGAAIELPWVLLGLRLQLDSIGQVFLLFTALLWWIAGLYARKYFASREEQRRFFAFYLPAMAGNLGLILAQDLFSFLSFYTLMSFASYGLVIHRGDREARRAGTVYLILVLIGEVLLFNGLLLYDSGGESVSILTALLFVGFGIKAGALPLHVWLPLAHPAAPTPASAVLSGAMIKAGLLGWLRFLPLGQGTLPALGESIIALGLVAALGGVAIGFLQRNPKVLLAYSSISQMGLMTVIIGLGLVESSNWSVALPIAGFYALHHALVKGGLFLGVGMVEGAKEGKEARWVMMCMAIFALVMAGLPLTSGAIAKQEVKALLLLKPDNFTADWIPWLTVSTIATTMLMVRLLWLLKNVAGSHANDRGLPWRPWLLLLVCSLLAGAGGHIFLVDSTTSMTWSAWWPPLLGVGLAMSVLMRKSTVFSLHVPAGDILVIYTVLIRWSYLGWRSAVSRLIIFYRITVVACGRTAEKFQRMGGKVSLIEASLQGWAVGGALMMVLLAILALLMR